MIYRVQNAAANNGKIETHLGVPQQLHHPTLVSGESSDLPHDRAHEFGAGRLDALAVAGTDSLRNGCCGVALVETTAEIYRTHHLRRSAIVLALIPPFTYRSGPFFLMS